EKAKKKKLDGQIEDIEEKLKSHKAQLEEYRSSSDVIDQDVLEKREQKIEELEGKLAAKQDEQGDVTGSIKDIQAEQEEALEEDGQCPAAK
ncbi:unnamed protein product, partial [Symbiodinium pilosum]